MFLEIHLQWYSRIWFGMSCRCAIRFLNFHFHRSLGSNKGRKMTSPFQSLVDWTTIKGIVNKWYARMWLDSPCRFLHLHFAPSSKKEIFKKLYLYNLTQFHFPIFYDPPLRKMWPSFQQIWIPFTKGYYMPSFF